MKHHIKNLELKNFKKYLWELRGKNINFQFIVNDQVIRDYTNSLVNYGVIPDAEDNKDNTKYQFLLCLKKQPAEKFYIFTKDISYSDENGKAELDWISTDGEKKKIIVMEVNND